MVSSRPRITVCTIGPAVTQATEAIAKMPSGVIGLAVVIAGGGGGGTNDCANAGPSAATLIAIARNAAVTSRRIHHPCPPESSPAMPFYIGIGLPPHGIGSIARDFGQFSPCAQRWYRAVSGIRPIHAARRAAY